MHNNTVFDCNILHFPKIHNRGGNLSVVENSKHIPFDVKRVYYLYDIPGGESRGAHAHKTLQQLIVAASGSFDVTIDDGNSKKTINLNRPYIGLYICPGMWRDLSNFSSGAVCLVLASSKYDENDYIRDYTLFKNSKFLSVIQP
jgi:WxcM-like, C-terminal